MPDLPFDRTNVGLRERPLSGDHNQLQSQIYRTITELYRATVSPRVSSSSSAMRPISGMIGDGLRVVPSSPAAMTVQVSAGFGFLYNATDLPSDLGATDLENVDDLSTYKPVGLMQPIVFSVPAAPSAGTMRCDIIEAKIDRRLENSIPRRQLDTVTRTFLDHSFFKTLSFMLDGRTGIVTEPAPSTAGLSYKIGTPVSGSLGSLAVPPATTTGYTRIAEVFVPSGTTTIAGTKIVDRRVILFPGGTVIASLRFRLQWNSGSPTVTVIDQLAPPGIELTILPLSSNKGFFVASAFGGELAHAAVQMTACQTIGTPLHPVAIVEDPASVFISNLNITSDAFLALEPSMVPAISIGVRQRHAEARFQCFDLTSSGPDDTTSVVEDLIINATFFLGY